MQSGANQVTGSNSHRGPQLLSFNTAWHATVWGHTHNDTHWYVQKSRGILMSSYLNFRSRTFLSYLGFSITSPSAVFLVFN